MLRLNLGETTFESNTQVMLDRETLITLFEPAICGLAFNLGFIPADKLDWKPAPDAKSAIEIVNHLGEFISSVSLSLQANSSGFAPVHDVPSAQRELSNASAVFVEALRAASPEKLKEMFHTEWGITNGWIVTAAVIDAIHHSGQIAYIQTLLGDTEIHFDSSTYPDFAVG